MITAEIRIIFILHDLKSVKGLILSVSFVKIITTYDFKFGIFYANSVLFHFFFIKFSIIFDEIKIS